jgi:hypothetical protein
MHDCMQTQEPSALARPDIRDLSSDELDAVSGGRNMLAPANLNDPEVQAIIARQSVGLD